MLEDLKLLLGISEEDNAVISTGGGCVLRPENSAALKKHGKIIFLKVDIAVLFERTGHTSDDRPLLKNTTFDKMKELLDYRTPIYESCADHTIDTNGKDIEQVAREICAVCGIPVIA